MTPPDSVPDSDRDLMRQAQRGNRQAVETLYARYRRKVLNYLYRFTGNQATAEELTQETFLRVVTHIRQYRPTGSVAGWIYRIAGNLALNALRDRPKVQEISLDEPLEFGEEDSVDRSEAIPGPGKLPDEEASRSERESAVQGALLKVAPHHREVLILCDIEGYTYQEAAQILKCPINTIASRLARGRAELAQLLGYLKAEGF